MAAIHDKPELMRDREDFLTFNYIFAPIAPVISTGVSRYFFDVRSDEVSQLLNGIFVDLVFEMGAAFIGDVATVMFINIRS